jgi:hypothetical protein
VNDALKDTATAQEYFNGSGWLNSGGDRTWISPEGETHVADLAQYPAGIEVPGTVDPGSYGILSATGLSAAIGSNMVVRFHRSGRDIPFQLKKTIQGLDKPPVSLPEGVKFAGYRMDTTLRALELVIASARPGLWSLLQVPGGGDILCPVRESAVPRAFFQKSAYERSGNLITVRVETNTSYKFSLKAHDSTGRLLYRKLDGARSMLVVRDFAVDDDSRYADFPCSNPFDDGYLTEIYVDDGQLGGFGEMEYHSPAIEMNKGEYKIEDSSETWGFVGPEEGVEELVGRFVGEVG